VLCKKCDIDLPSGSRFCQSCGQTRVLVLPRAAARRIVTCLCAPLWLILFLSPLLADTPPDATDPKVIGLVQHADDLCQTGRAKEAQPLLSEAASLKPDYPDTYRVWGCAYQKERQYPQAEEQYKKWAELKPDSYRPFEALGEIAYEQSHYAESNDYLAKAKRLNPYRTYIISYRCHNFVLMQKWQDAIAECTQALALSPKDQYAHGERAKAERALGENDKASEDVADAGRYGSDFGETTFVMRKMFPVIFGFIALTFLFTGLAVLLRKKPLLFSSRWMFALMVLCFFPQFILPIQLLRLPGDQAGAFRMIGLLGPAMFVVLLVFLWIQMQGYVAMGIVDKSFRKALLSVLDDLQLEREEQLSIIRIPQANLDIQIAIQSWIGVGQIKNKSKNSEDVFQQIIAGLKRRFALGELETNNTTPAFYVIVGVFLLIFCGSFLFAFHPLTAAFTSLAPR
jgi:tetratricopeptide (TPR) repeat protein